MGVAFLTVLLLLAAVHAAPASRECPGTEQYFQACRSRGTNATLCAMPLVHDGVTFSCAMTNGTCQRPNAEYSEDSGVRECVNATATAKQKDKVNVCISNSFCVAGGIFYPKTNEQGCFPRDAQVTVLRSDGKVISVAISSVSPGDRVLAWLPSKRGGSISEPDLVFSEVYWVAGKGGSEPTEHWVVSHSAGTIRATPSHLILARRAEEEPALLPISHILPGDSIFLHSRSSAAETKVHSVKAEFHHEGAFAPVTVAGTIVVDGALASSYGTAAVPVFGGHWSHNLIHGALAPARLARALLSNTAAKNIAIAERWLCDKILGTQF